MNSDTMTADLLRGLFAYDTGCVDSGIKDEDKRAEMKEFLQSAVGDELLVEIIRDYVSPGAIEAGYGPADVAEFIRWLSERMECDL